MLKVGGELLAKTEGKENILMGYLDLFPKEWEKKVQNHREDDRKSIDQIKFVNGDQEVIRSLDANPLIPRTG